MESLHQYWMLVMEDDYAEFDHELRMRSIFARSAREMGNGCIVVYYECTQKEQDEILIKWRSRI